MVRYFRNFIENMVADDLIANPNLYPSNANSSQNNTTGQTGTVAGPSNPVVGTSPFSMFYKPLSLDDLKVSEIFKTFKF